MRKSIMVFCLVLILSYTLPLFVHAELPDNDVPGTFYLDVLDMDAGANYANFPSNMTFDHGSLYVLSFIPVSPSSISGKVTIHFNVDLTINSNVNFYFLEGFSSSSLDVPSFSMTPTLIINKNTSESVSLASKYPLTPFSYSGEYTPVRFYYNFSDNSINHISSIPSDIVGTLSFSGFPVFEPSSYRFQFRVDVNSSDGSFDIPLGFFFDAPLTGDPIADYENGDITFSAANNAIRSEIDQIVNSNMSNTDKQYLLGLQSYKLDQLQSISDAKFSTVVDNFTVQSADIVNSYIDTGSTDVLPAISELNLSYTDALTQAVTPEQAELILSRHSVTLNQIQAVFDVNYKNELDSVITDSDLADKEAASEHLSSLLDIEDDVRQTFIDSDYESYIQFEDWYSTVDPDEITVIKSIYEFFLSNDSAVIIRPFLTIPFSLFLVGVLLSTTAAISRRR